MKIVPPVVVLMVVMLVVLVEVSMEGVPVVVRVEVPVKVLTVSVLRHLSLSRWLWQAMLYQMPRCLRILI